MLIYLYGADSYRRGKKLRELVDRYKQKYEQVDFLDIDLEECPKDWVVVRDFLGQTSLFVSSKLCVVRGSGAVSEKNGVGRAEAKEWVVLLKTFLEDKNRFVIVVDQKKPLKAFQFLLKPPVKAQEFAELSGRQLEAFVLQEAKRCEVRFQDSARRAFLKYVLKFQDRGWIVVSLLRQLSLAKFHGELSLGQLQQLVPLEEYGESFQIALSLLRANKGYDRLERLEELRLRGDESMYTFNLLGSLVRGEDALLFARHDEMIKSGEADDEVALTGFVLGL